MRRRRHAEHVNHERWLVSYADLLTLLLAFFVVLFASSIGDKKKAAKMAAAMQTAFQQSGIFDMHSDTPPLADSASPSQGTPSPIELPIETAGANSGENGGTREGERQAMEKTFATAIQEHMVTVRDSSDGLTLSLDSAGFFPSGSADVRTSALPLLARIAGSLPQTRLRVEGHTDNQPIHTLLYRSNWELSTARAAAIAEVLLRDSHVQPENFAIAGYGEFHPIADNDTEAGRAMNRRVDIVLIRTASAVRPASTSSRQAPSR